MGKIVIKIKEREGHSTDRKLFGNEAPDKDDAALEAGFRVLGVDAHASGDEIQAAWQRNLAKFNPDLVREKGLAPEWLEFANAKTAEINEAYDILRNAGWPVESTRETMSPNTGGEVEQPKRAGGEVENGRVSIAESQRGITGAVEMGGTDAVDNGQGYSESLEYRCPHCGARFAVSEDSEGYEVACPGCGEMLDLTELDPLAPGMAVSEAAASSAFGSSQGGETTSPPSSGVPPLAWRDEPSAAQDGGNLIYRCPHCSEGFAVEDDSDAYLVQCPSCGKTIDLTELEPEAMPLEAPQETTFGGLTIEETIRDVRAGSAPDPAAKAIENAISSASAAAGNVAAMGLRTFRRIQASLGKADTVASCAEAPAESLPPEVRMGFSPVESHAGRSDAAPPASLVFEDWTAAFRAGRYAAAIAISQKTGPKGALAECRQKVRRAAASGDRDAMLALAGSLLRGIGCPADSISAKFWQNRAKASSAEFAGVLKILGDSGSHF